MNDGHVIEPGGRQRQIEGGRDVLRLHGRTELPGDNDDLALRHPRCGALLAPGGANDKSQTYPLGYSEVEARRLEQQAALYKELTEDVLRRAGLCAGMRVLDVGCGVGDVSLLAAELVGERVRSWGSIEH